MDSTTVLGDAFKMPIPVGYGRLCNCIGLIFRRLDMVLYIEISTGIQEITLVH